MVWKHSDSPKPKKYKQIFHGRKQMGTVFWERKGVLFLVAFMNPRAEVTLDVYCEMLKRIKRAI
jgi:hypothetical protein